MGLFFLYYHIFSRPQWCLMVHLVNALAAQRQCMVNVFRACVGLQPEDHMLLEHKLPSEIVAYREAITLEEKGKTSPSTVATSLKRGTESFVKEVPACKRHSTEV